MYFPAIGQALTAASSAANTFPLFMEGIALTKTRMHRRYPFLSLMFSAAVVPFLAPLQSFAQQAAPTQAAQGLNFVALPDAPQPRIEVAMMNDPALQGASAQDQTAQKPAPAQDQSSSSSQSTSAQTDAQQTQQQKAQKQIQDQEHQRVLGIVPTFNTTYLGGQTVSMTGKQKISLAFHSSTDPFAFAIPFVVAGYHEALDEDKGFPWGIKGLGERAGAAYLDSFDGNMLGNGFLPALLHQDPRYYRMGQGSVTRRILYAAATSVICKHDITGKWEPNYSNIAGNIIGGALSNLYYPSSDTGVGLTISNGFIVTAEGAFGSEFNEFWPDVSRKLFHKDPTHGLDAQRKAEEESKKNSSQSQQ
jgi:hypothetical protein